jgi:hypothetical protein
MINANIINRIDEMLNPIAVKELRQAVQGKFVVGILLLFLTVAVGAIGMAAMAYDEQLSNLDSGRYAFLFFMGILMGTCLLFIPVYASSRIAMERSDSNTDLLFATTLKPGAIIRGKFISAMILCILIYSACMPFMVLTYLLRGIDLPSIFFLLGVGILTVMAGLQASIFLGCLPISKLFKGLLGLAGFSGLLLLVFMVMEISETILRQGIPSLLGFWNFWGPILGIVGLVFMGMGFLHVLSATIITPPSANRALPVRIYMTSAWLVCTIVAVVWGAYSRRSFASNQFLVMMWAILFVSLFSLAFLAGISEREKLGPRVARKVPKRLIFRIPAFLFYSGAGGGVIWAILMMALTIGVSYYYLYTMRKSYGGNSDLEQCLQFLLPFSLYIIGYGLLALLLRRLMLGKFIKSTMTWAMAFILIVIGSVVPPLIAFFSKIKMGYQTGHEWFLGNPFGELAYDRQWKDFLTVSAVFASLLFVISVPWLFKQMRQFKPDKNINPAQKPQP